VIPSNAVSAGDVQLRRLRWRCRRGMRELDALLMRYVDACYPQAPAAEKAGFERLICLPDPEILGLLTGRERSEDVEIRAVVGAIIAGTVR